MSARLELARKVPTATRIIFRTLALLWQAAPVDATLLTVGLLIQSVIPALILYITKLIIDTISEDLRLEALGSLVVLWVIVLSLDVILNPWISVVQGNLGEKLTGYVGLITVEKSTSFPGLLYFESREFYDEVEFVKNNSGWRPVNLVWYMLSTFREIVTVFSILILLSTIAWWVPWLLMIATVPQIVINMRLKEQTYAAVSINTMPLRQMHHYRMMMTNDKYAKEVRAFDLADFLKARFLQAFSQTFVDVQRLRTKQAVWATLLLCLSVAANTFAFYYSLQQTIDDVISIGNILILVQSLAVIQRQLGDLAEFGASGLFENLLYMNRLFRFLDLEPDLPIAESVQPVPQRLTNGIRLEKVGFNYPDGRTALKDISLTIEPGQVVAIVGENGAGKTTLVKLLSRFYDPTCGQITIDGTPLPQMDLRAWRQRVAPVFQDFNHFPLTIGENIRIGSIHSNDVRVEQIGEAAGLQPLATSLPSGYDTLLGKEFDGTELSGGQWQKIALARALARQDDALLLILDEPTAALDPRSEAEIFEQFAKLASGRTTLLVTHRLASVKLADRILVMKDGKVVEDGTHADLLAHGGEYADLWRLQAQFYQKAP